MSETKHTPTPWSYIGDDDGDFVIWGGNDDKFIANVGSDRLVPVLDDPQKNVVAFDLEQANARLIVTAVNSLPLLQEAERALEKIANLWPMPPNCAEVNPEHIGPNAGKGRAILLEAALQISRAALARIREAKDAGR